MRGSNLASNGKRGLQSPMGANRPKRAKMSQKLRLNLIDLDNHHCLVDILANLDLEDLLTVAHTSKQMRTVAELALKIKYIHHSVPLPDDFYYRDEPTVWINSLRSCDMKTALQFIRCFGKSVVKLRFGWYKRAVGRVTRKMSAQTKVISAFYTYANEYSNASLNNLTLFNIEGEFFDNVNKPFMNVEVLTVNNCAIPKDRIDWMFPNILHFSFLSSDMRCIEHHFPKLLSLELKPIYSEFNGNAVDASITECFRLNPQLCKLRLESSKAPISVKLLEEASELLPSLLILESEFDPFEATPMIAVHFKSVTKFTFVCTRGLGLIPFTFEDLKQFEYRYYNHDGIETNYGRLNDFLRKHKSIDELIVNNEFMELSNVPDILPALEKLIIHGDFPIKLDDAIAVLRKTHTINRFAFCLENEDNDWNQDTAYHRLNAFFAHEFSIEREDCEVEYGTYKMKRLDTGSESNGSESGD